MGEKCAVDCKAEHLYAMPQGKVLGGCGVPRTASLPQLAPPSSSNASPEDRARTSLANSASAPAVPPAGLADSQPAGGAVLSAPLEQSSYSARPSSAPPSSYGQPDGRSFRSATDPFPSPTEWPGVVLALFILLLAAC